MALLTDGKGERIATSQVEVTVLIPTIGRANLLSTCLKSIAATRPLPAEILVVDQSDGSSIRALTGAFPDLPLRVVPCEGRGIARGVNLGLREARYEQVLITHDDCTVSSDWVGTGLTTLDATPGAILSGRVLPVGDPRYVPSTKIDEDAHDYTGELVIDGLYGNNLAMHRAAVLEIGGFDERDGFQRASEDNDLCFRWLRAGRTLRYVPELVVHHHDWRTAEQLVNHYRTYILSDGALFAKYLLRKEWAILPFALRELGGGFRGLLSGLLRLRPAWQDPRRHILIWLPVGFVKGLREELHIRRTSRTDSPAELGRAGAP